MTQPVVVIGGGGMGRCILDVISDLTRTSAEGEGFELVGVLDDNRINTDLLELWDTKHLGPVDRLADLPSDVGYVIGIGDGRVRRKIDGYGLSLGRNSPTLIHPNVHLGRGVHIGPGAVVCSHVSIENNIRLGRHVHVNQNSTIGHDSLLEDFVTVSPLVALSGSIRACEAAFIGTGASLRQGLTLGTESTVAMGASVIHDVAPGASVMGVPAKKKG